ncbi:MAG: DUF4124 domain-containing protein [Proteobacteria bacterium]|nr:DUF4124 domain-containing protein [Pseudomonadota bacterium]
MFARYYRRMRKLLLLMMLVSLPVAAVTMYTWEDEDGLVHYADTPRPGAIAIEVDAVQGFAPSPLYMSEESAISRDSQNTGAYETFAITAPGQGEVFWNIGGVVNVVIEISPPPRGGDTIALFFDGQNMSAPGSRRRSYVLNDVYRGTHTVRAVVNSRNGDEIQQTELITFQVHQTSIK